MNTVLHTILKLIVGGEALSHCVRYTLTDIIKYWHEGTDAKKRLVLLKDGSSPVVRYEESARAFLEDMRNEGVTITTCAEVFSDKIIQTPVSDINKSKGSSIRGAALSFANVDV